MKWIYPVARMLILVAMLVAALSSCPNGQLASGNMRDDMAELTINVSNTLEERTIAPSAENVIAQYEIIGEGPSAASFGPLTYGVGEMVTVSEIETGDWTVTVHGLDDAGNSVARGIVMVTIVAGGNTVNVVVRFLQEEAGSMELLITWPEIAAVDSVIVTIDGANPEEIYRGYGTAAYYQKTGIPSGGRNLAMKLYGGGTLRSSIWEVMHIYDHQTTQASIAIAEADLTLPQAPGLVNTTAIGDREVVITWDASKVRTETGFIVERSETPDFSSSLQIETTTENVGTWNDNNLLPGVVYYYRVASVNTYGYSRWVNSSPVRTSLKWSLPGLSSYGISSTPAVVADGTIFIATWEGVNARNPDGTEKWLFAWPQPGVGYCTPSIGADGTIYVSKQDTLYAINPSGTEKWTFATSGVVHSPASISTDGMIYVGTYDGVLHALNPDGSEKWSAQVADRILYAPAIGTDGTVYVGSNTISEETQLEVAAFLYALDPVDGSEKWHFEPEHQYIYRVAATSGPMILLATHANIYALNSNGTEKWRLMCSFSVNTDFAIDSEGTIYCGVDKKILAVNPDGILKWAVSFSEFVQSSPAVGADGTIYVCRDADDSGYSRLYALDPDGSIVWDFDAAGHMSSVVIAPTGDLYLCTRAAGPGALYALHGDSAGPANSAWPMYRHDARHTGCATQ